MKIMLKSRQNGFAIIEALIAFLLLGIGVAALLYLQGNLMSGSSLSKARAEAMELAQFRMEILRNYAEEAEFQDALYSAVQKEPGIPIQGVNAEYTVSYELNGIGITKTSTKAQAQLSTSVTQQIVVTVNWSGSEVNPDSTPKVEEVSLETMLYFIKPEIVAAISDQNDGESDPSDFPLPSPWLTGVEKEHESTDKFKVTDPHNSVDPVVEEQRLIEIDGSGNVTFDTTNIEIITYYNSDTGLSNVEVVHGKKFIDVNGIPVEVPDVKLTSFGGIVHKIKGEIILHHDADTELADIVDNFQLLASPPSYCVSPICANGDCLIPSCADGGSALCSNAIPGGQSARYVSYVCYVPGDCTHGDEDGDDTKGCTVPFNPPPDKDLNGGWYGRIGNFNLFLDRERDMICTADTLIGGSTPNLTPSREYVTHRWELDTTQSIAGNEGINRPFDCDPDPLFRTGEAFAQTFIIAGIVTNKETACTDIAAQYTVGVAGSPLFLPPENVIRIIGENTAIPASLSPTPYLHPPLDDLTPPYTVNNVVRESHAEHCVPAPVPPVP